ncbi:MAG: hypothetical protein EOP32_39670 [Rhodococcus sp. (in: high G+C Gram-positive bacteria)]|nr:MAG: hypothetical protein EOP32_39670 [Rhodococcus sp. (in: high G+C Gram-positive bacteria)]
MPTSPTLNRLQGNRLHFHPGGPIHNIIVQQIQLMTGSSSLHSALSVSVGGLIVAGFQIAITRGAGLGGVVANGRPRSPLWAVEEFSQTVTELHKGVQITRECASADGGLRSCVGLAGLARSGCTA